jgi:hypothetical protein
MVALPEATPATLVPICRPAYWDLMTESGQENRTLGRFSLPIWTQNEIRIFENN